MKKLKFVSVLLAMLTAFSCISAFPTSAVVLDKISTIEIADVPSSVFYNSVEEMLYGLKIKVNYADETTKTFEVTAEAVEYEDYLDDLAGSAFAYANLGLIIDTNTRVDIEAYNYVSDFVKINVTAYQGYADEYSYEAELWVGYPSDFDTPRYFCHDYLVYRENDDNTLTLVNFVNPPEYDNNDPVKENYEIPEEVDGRKVTEIADYAFLGTGHPLSVTIPDTVTSIGEYAMGYCFSPFYYGDNHKIPENVDASRLSYALAIAEETDTFLVCINFYGLDNQALSDSIKAEYLSACTDYEYDADMEWAYATLTKEQIYSLQGVEDILIELLYERDTLISDEVFDFGDYIGEDCKMPVGIGIYAETDAELEAICAELSKLYFGGRTDYAVDANGYMLIDASLEEIRAASKDESVSDIFLDYADGLFYDLYKELYFQDSDYTTDVFAVSFYETAVEESYAQYAEEYFPNCEYEIHSFEGQKTLIIKGATKEQILTAGELSSYQIDLFASPLISRYYDFEIHGKNGSAAQAYAEQNSISFVGSGSEYQLGDVDLDGILSVKDATLILKQNVCLVSFTAEQEELADFDGDGRISVTDATAIQKALIKS